jgi:tetratricopeptide (TPR) repeat protein
LASVDLRQIGLVNLLGHTWDTVGWIYFMDGKYEPAEKYLRAAWDLEQDPTIGDHLGQLYEKMNRKNDAIEMYAEALTSPRVEAETRTRFTALAGDDAAAMTSPVRIKASHTMTEERTAHLGKLAPTGTADYLISFSAPGKIDEVKFISGADSNKDGALKNIGPKLQAATFHESFPDSSPTKLIRRATVACGPTGCDATLINADSVSSVD